MSKKSLVNNSNNFIKKSNVIVRTITNDTSGLLTQKLFNFAISSIKTKTDFNGIIKLPLKDFCNFHNISTDNLYKKVIHKKNEMTVIEKEIDNITSLKFWLQDDAKEEYSFINLFERGTWFKGQGIIEFKVVKDLIQKHYIDIKKDYTNIYLPYTKEVTSKYSMRLYEYFRSYLYYSNKTISTPYYKHTWEFKQLAKILNLSLNSSYFKIITKLKTRILEPIKRDLAKTDINFTYQLIKTGRKFTHIILNTVLDKKKFESQVDEKQLNSSENEFINHNFNYENIINISKENSDYVDGDLLDDEQIVWDK